MWLFQKGKLLSAGVKFEVFTYIIATTTTTESVKMI